MKESNQAQKEQCVIILPKQTKVTEEMIKRLDNLLSFASPEELRRNVTEIYHSYVIHEFEMFPSNFEKLATNMYFLISFLDKSDKEMNAEIERDEN